MKYTMNVKITNPEPYEGMENEIQMSLDCCFCYDENQYGNGHYVSIKGQQFYPQYIDLRYDQSFDRNNKEKWLEEWAKNYWSGKNGSYSVESLTITNLD